MKTSNRISKQHYFMQVVAYSLIGCMFLTSLISVVLADANPPPGTLPSGVLSIPNGSVGSFDYSPGRLDIRDVAHQTVINWNNFDIGSGATTQFHQLGGPSSAVMNRIYDGSPTGIFGSLLGNGRIFIVNPAGVIFGAGSTVNVNQLVASSLKMTDQDFLNATNVVNPLDMKFELSGDGVVENYGTITASDSVYLVGKNVLNAGTIISPGGLVVLAAGEEVWLAQPGSDVVVKKLAAPSQQDHTVVNSGTIEAAGGEIILAAGDVFSNAVDVPEAVGVGKVGQFGVLNADGVEGDGGSINMTAGEVVALGSESLTTANAGTNGDGGEVIVYSPGAALFWEGARIEAKGGSESGNGGFVELSGKQHVEIYGLVDTTAANGQVGNFLIDPFDIEIGDWTPDGTQNGSWSGTGSNPHYWTSNITADSRLDVDNLLNYLDNTDVTVRTGYKNNNPSNYDGDITVNAAINYSDVPGKTYNDLTLQASDDIIVNYGITSGTHDLTLTAKVYGSDGDVTLNAPINSTTGNISASGVYFTSNSGSPGGTITTTGGNVTLNFDRDITLGAAISSTSGDIGLYANLSNNNYNIYVNSGGISSTTGSITLDVDAGNKGGNVILGAAVGTTTGDVSAYGDNFTSTGSGTITTTGTSAGEGDVMLNFDEVIDLGGAVSTQAGNIGLNANRSGGNYNLNVNGGVSSTTGNITLNADVSGGGGGGGHDDGDVYVNAATSSTTGNISAYGDYFSSNGSGTIATTGGSVLLDVDDNITLGGAVTLNNGGALNLDALNNIYANAAINSTGGNVIMTAGSDSGDDEIDIQAPINISGGGTLTLTANGSGDNDIRIRNPITMGNGDLTATSDDDISLGYNSSTGGITVNGSGNVSLTASDDIEVTSTSSGIALNGNGSVLLDAGDYVTTNAPITLTGSGSATLKANANILINAPITMAGGDVTLGPSANPAFSVIVGDGVDITGAGNLMAYTVHGIVLGGDVDVSGNIGLYADTDTRWGYDVIANGALSAGGKIDVEGTNVYLKDATSGDDMKLYAHGLYAKTGSPEPLVAGGNVDVSGKLDSGGNIEITAKGFGGTPVANGPDLPGGGEVPYSSDGSIYLRDSAEAAVNMTLTAGHDMHAYRTLEAGSNITISASDNTIVLDDDVTAVGLDLELKNNTVAADGITLKAGRYVEIWPTKSLTAQGDLTIEAGDLTATSPGGEIQAESSDLIMAADGKTLTLSQNGTLDMESIFGSISNRGNTYLVANSTAGSVTSDEADEWQSIGATAYTDITLSGNSGNIMLGESGEDATKSLWAKNGNIDVTSAYNIEAAKDLTSGGDMTLQAGGDVIAHGNLNAGGNISIDASVDTIYLGGDHVVAVGNVLLNDNTELNGGASQRIEATTGTLTATGNVDKTTDGDLNLNGGSGIYLAGNVTTHDGDLTFEDNVIANGSGDQRFDAGTVWASAGNILTAQEDISKTTAGNLNLDAGRGDSEIHLAGDVTTLNGNLTFEDKVIADGSGDQRFDAGTVWASLGNTLTAQEDISKTTAGNLNLDAGRGDSEIHLAGDVTTLNGNLTFEDKVIADGSGDQRFDAGTVWASLGNTLTAQEDISKTTAGNLNLDAGRGDSEIHLAGDVTTLNGNLTFEDKVIADGSGDQRFDAGTVWASLGNTLTAQEDISKTTAGDLNLDAGRGDSEIHLAGDVTTLNGNLTFEDRVIADGSGNQRFDAGTVWASLGNTLTAQEDISKTTAGNLNLDAGRGDSEIHLAGDVTTSNGNLVFEDRVVANGDGAQKFAAGGMNKDLVAEESIDKITDGSLTLGAGWGIWAYIYLAGDVTTHDGDLTFEDNVIANSDGDQRFDAGTTWHSWGNALIAKGDISKTTDGSLTLDGGRDDSKIYLAGDVTTHDGDLTFEDDVIANGIGYFGFGRNQTFQANGFGKVLHAEETITKETRGNLTLAGGYYADSGYEIDLDGDVTVQKGSLILGDWSFFFVDDDVTVAPDCTLQASDDVKVYDDLDGEGDLTVLAGHDIELQGNVKADGDLDLSTETTTTIYLWGNAYASGDLTLHSNTKLVGWWGDQTLEAGGTLTAEGYVRKCTWGDMWLLGWGTNEEGKSIDLRYSGCGLGDPAASTYKGNLWMLGEGDIQISGDVTSFGPGIWGWGHTCDSDWQTGGVSIISQTGKIYTDWASPNPEAGDYMLNVAIMGSSDDITHRIPDGKGTPRAWGVDLPYGEGKAAIVVMSNEDLKFGPDSELIACGAYDSAVVDDRPSVNFLAEPGVSIGGNVRDEGLPIDVAVYVASTGTNTDAGQGDVHLEGDTIDVATGGTIVVDAYDTVTFGAFGALGIDRMEVVSRISEWMDDAVGRLPFAGDAAGEAAFEALMGGELVYRGAGLGNVAITDGRAWVLENKPVSSSAAPIGGLLTLGVENAGLGGGGCPALMTWLSKELGVDKKELQVYLENVFVYSTDCQPCEMAAKLKDLAVILEDPEGIGVAALAQVISEFITTPAPPSEEEMAAIAERLAGHIGDDTYYAAAEQWIDALVAYVGILTDGMGWPLDKAVAFVMENYGSPVTDSGNAALVAYVQARLAASGGGVL